MTRRISQFRKLGHNLALAIPQLHNHFRVLLHESLPLGSVAKSASRKERIRRAHFVSGANARQRGRRFLVARKHSETVWRAAIGSLHVGIRMVAQQ